MAVVDVLEVEYNLKGNYARQMAGATAATSGFGKAFGEVNRAQMIGGFARTLGTAAVAATALGVALGARAMVDSASFDSLVKGLESVEGGADAAKRKIEELKKVAAAPGIGFEESVSGYGGLRRSGLDPEFAMRLVKEAGNVNAASGGGVERFEQIMRAFTQISSKPYLQGDELLQLNEAGIPIQKMLKDAFGTSDTAEFKKAGITSTHVLEGLVSQMEKMPRVGGGFQNVMDNFADTMKFASVEVGNGLNAHLLPLLSSFADGISEMSADGRLEQLGSSFGDLVVSMSEAIGGVNGLTEAMQTWADGAIKINEAFADQGVMSYGTLGFIAKPIWDYIMGKDIKEQTAEVEVATAKMQEDPRHKTQIKTMNANKLTKMRAAEEDKEKMKKEKEEKRKTPTQTILEKIEENTRVLPEFAKAAWGGGELARLGVTAHEVKAARRERKMARNLRQYAEIAAMPGARTVAR